MYHARFKGTHYDAGYKWGDLLYKNGNIVSRQPTFSAEKEKMEFSRQCLPIYQKYYPEVLKEIEGIARGQRIEYMNLCAFLMGMYCFELKNHCTCFAYSDENAVIFARNSDFLTALEKLNMNCLYNLDGGYAFCANTTAFVQMEDGVNRQGLAAGLTFIVPHKIKPGFNGGMLVRLILEKCSDTRQALKLIEKIPVASAQTITIADRYGDIALVECNCDAKKVIRPKKGQNFVSAANHFTSRDMTVYNDSRIDNWQSRQRYTTACSALTKGNFAKSFISRDAMDILGGKHGFICQYDRKTGADTVWSAVYDLKNKEIYRCEGNPCRKQYKEDKRMKFDF